MKRGGNRGPIAKSIGHCVGGAIENLSSREIIVGVKGRLGLEKQVLDE